MKKSTMFVIGLLSLFIIIISFYTYESEDMIIEDVSRVAENSFHEHTEIETTFEATSFSFYLPEGLEVDEEDASNVILHSGEQTYIIFYNQFEEPTSELNYNNAKTDQAVLLESFEDEEKFGYIRVIPKEEKAYELQIGIGGVKITTITSTSKIEEDTEELMKTARSIIETEEL
ncbi:hypothetical protein ACFSTA_10705 [Ornithinibacillus salinisoli]|uniref:DUF4367 domain-containing protein n=1 Tax=Ornithinibacillus salinisoli TaxID=1848459 RepID=A0ABW4W7Q3_9BACI